MIPQYSRQVSAGSSSSESGTWVTAASKPSQEDKKSVASSSHSDSEERQASGSTNPKDQGLQDITLLFDTRDLEKHLRREVTQSIADGAGRPLYVKLHIFCVENFGGLDEVISMVRFLIGPRILELVELDVCVFCPGNNIDSFAESQPEAFNRLFPLRVFVGDMIRNVPEQCEIFWGSVSPEEEETLRIEYRQLGYKGLHMIPAPVMHGIVAKVEEMVLRAENVIAVISDPAAESEGSRAASSTPGSRRSRKHASRSSSSAGYYRASSSDSSDQNSIGVTGGNAAQMEYAVPDTPVTPFAEGDFPPLVSSASSVPEHEPVTQNNRLWVREDQDAQMTDQQQPSCPARLVEPDEENVSLRNEVDSPANGKVMPKGKKGKKKE